MNSIATSAFALATLSFAALRSASALVFAASAVVTAVDSGVQDFASGDLHAAVYTTPPSTAASSIEPIWT